MMRRQARIGLGAAVLCVAVLAAVVGATAAPRAHEPAAAKLWVFFTDKGIERAGVAAAVDAFTAELPERALARRARKGIPVNANDLPVSARYIEGVRGTGAEVVTRSRWLNAVSVVVGPAEREAIERLAFVREVRPVARGVKELPREAPPVGEERGGSGNRLDYGYSEEFLDAIQVPPMHDAGLDGTGILVCMLDTGFDTDHEAYRHLDIAGERDFINDDLETADEPGDPSGQDSHGTRTLSCVAGLKPGRFCGGAYNASVLLGKTEILDEEIQVEEDYWVEGVEWADSLGADIVSSSLGYLDWYTYDDMDGNTCVTTIAADMAAARGIVVVNSMGNEGEGGYVYMIAPADGDTVVSVGAIDGYGYRAPFSSRGPTSDGRMKPDVMAPGYPVYVVTTADTSSYGYSSGTSFSCPLTAGVVALLLQGHPDWTPQDVLDALHATATQSSSPDSLMGWGIVRGYDALYSSPLGVEDQPVAGRRLVGSHPNPFSPETVVEFAVPSAGPVRLEVFDVAGRLVRVLEQATFPEGAFARRWDGTDDEGNPVASGVYFVRLATAERRASEKVVLLR